jgi:ribosomal protein L37AE/L43A
MCYQVLVSAAANIWLCISCGAECAGTGKASVGRGWARPEIGAVTISTVP